MRWRLRLTDRLGTGAATACLGTERGDHADLDGASTTSPCGGVRRPATQCVVFAPFGSPQGRTTPLWRCGDQDCSCGDGATVGDDGVGAHCGHGGRQAQDARRGRVGELVGKCLHSGGGQRRGSSTNDRISRSVKRREVVNSCSPGHRPGKAAVPGAPDHRRGRAGAAPRRGNGPGIF